MPARLHRLAVPALAALGLAGCAGQSTTTAPSPSARSATTSGSAVAKRTRRSSQRRSGATTIAAGRLALITEPQAGVAPVLSALRGARHQVEMVMYEDEDSQVNAALAADEHRGVKVRVLLNGGYYGEGSTQNQAAYSYLRARSVPVKWTPSYFALTHQKTLLVDGRAYILTFNLTPQYYASSRDFGVIDTIAADDAAVQQTFNADWSGQRITAPNGAELLWSPGSEQAQVSLIESAQGFLDIYNEEMDSTPIEQALEADAQARRERRGDHDLRLLLEGRVRATVRRRSAHPHLQRERATVHPREDDSQRKPRVPRLAELLLHLPGEKPGTRAHHLKPDHSRFPAPNVRLRLRGRAPVHRPFPLLRRLVVGQRHSQPEFRRRALQREHVLLKSLRRLRRVRALKPARADRDRHRRRRTLGQLSHRLKRLRRRLLPRSGQRGRRDGHGARRARHLPRQAEPVMRAIPPRPATAN